MDVVVTGANRVDLSQPLDARTAVIQLPVLAETRSDRQCLIERSDFGVRRCQAAIIFTFVIDIASRMNRFNFGSEIPNRPAILAGGRRVSQHSWMVCYEFTVILLRESVDSRPAWHGLWNLAIAIMLNPPK